MQFVLKKQSYHCLHDGFDTTGDPPLNFSYVENKIHLPTAVGKLARVHRILFVLLAALLKNPTEKDVLFPE